MIGRARIRHVAVAGALLAVFGAQAASPATKTTKKATKTTKRSGAATTKRAPATTAAASAQATATTRAATTGAGAAGDVCTKEREGGALKVSVLAQATSMDTYTNTVSASMLSGWEGAPFYSTLFRLDLATGNYVPHVAESATANANFTQWVIKLRPGVTFGNGDPLNADAFMSHLDRHLSSSSRSALRGTSRIYINDWQKVDAMSVRFTLSRPFSSFPSLFVNGLGLVQNTKIIDQMGQEAFSKFPKGAGVGPYEIVRWAPPEAIVFKAKENWWGGPVCIKDLTVTFIGNTVAAYEAFKKNEVQIVGMNRDPETQDKAVKENPGRVKGQFNNAAWMVMPNIRAAGYNGPFADLRARQAVAHAIDPELINQRALGGKGLPGNGIINPKTTTLKATQGLGYDPNKARDLVNQVKADRNWDGTVNAICADTPASNKEACITVQALLNNVGFKVNLNTMPTGALITQVGVQRRYDLVASWGIINPEYELWRGFAPWDTRNALNYNGYDNQQFDAVLDRLQAAPNRDAYQRAVNDLQELVNKEVPFVVYGATEDVTIWKENVKGLIFSSFAPHLDKAYLAK